MLNKRTAIAIAAVSLASLLTGCGSSTVIMVPVTSTPDPRVIQITVTDTVPVLVTAAPIIVPITNTPDPRVIQITVTNTVSAQATTAPLLTAGALPNGPTATPEANAPVNATPVSTIAAPVVPTAAVVSPEPSTPVFPAPTDTRVQLYIAQENFQSGYMFWISATKEIWVLFPAANTPANQTPTSGEWRIYKDTYLDSEPEVDPAIIPPASNLYQPRRGFGKLWRTVDNIRGALGWGTTPEFGLTTSYVYQPGGHADPTQTQWIGGPGTHFVITLGRETFAFHEPAQGQQYGTWNKVS